MRRRVRFITGAASDLPRASEPGAGSAKIQDPVLEADESNKPEPAPKRRGRKATGCVTKAQLLEVLSSHQDDEAAGSAEGGGAGARVRIQVVQADQEEGPAPKRKGRKATGIVTQEQLLAALQQVESDEEEHEDGEGGDGQSNCSAEGAGGVSRRGAEGSQRQVMIVLPEDTDEGEESEADGPVVVRKATGRVTTQQLLEIAMQEDDAEDPGSSEDEEDGALPRKRAGARVTIVVSENTYQDSDADDESPGPAVVRKATGCVTKKQLLEVAIQECDSDDASGSDEEEGDAPPTKAAGQRVAVVAPEDAGEAQASELPVILAAPRRRGRKATGVVTKEQLLDALSTCGKDAGIAEPVPLPLPQARSELSMAEEAADKADELQAGWLCCGGNARWRGGI